MSFATTPPHRHLAMPTERLPYRVVTITPRQEEMLLDRLEGAGGASIAEALGITPDQDDAYAAAERAVIDQVKRRRIVLQNLDPLALRILADAMDGSTWCALHDDGGVAASPALRGARRTVEATHRKLTRAGLRLQPPVLW